MDIFLCTTFPFTSKQPNISSQWLFFRTFAALPVKNNEYFTFAYYKEIHCAFGDLFQLKGTKNAWEFQLDFNSLFNNHDGEIITFWQNKWKFFNKKVTDCYDDICWKKERKFKFENKRLIEPSNCSTQLISLN